VLCVIEFMPCCILPKTLGCFDLGGDCPQDGHSEKPEDFEVLGPELLHGLRLGQDHSAWAEAATEKLSAAANVKQQQRVMADLLAETCEPLSRIAAASGAKFAKPPRRCPGRF
jgi:hypothetical protein